MIADVHTSLGTDFYLLDELLTDEERGIRDRVRDFCDREVIPVMGEYWDKAEFPLDLFRKFAELDICGGSINGYGCPGMSKLAEGLLAVELARGDGSLNTAFGVHSGLAMGSIAILGSEEQKEKYLPSMAKMETLGCFALTEPDHGSDVVMLETFAMRDGDEYIINGKKKWIGGGTYSDIAIVWARDASDMEVKGFIVETDSEGYSAEVQTGKMAKRAVWQAEITFDNVRIPAENKLEKANSFKDTSKVLTATRYGVAWEGIGHAVASYEAAVQYAKDRKVFTRPLESYQLIQNRLANMLSEITHCQLMAHRLAALFEEGKMTGGMASIAKMSIAKKCKQVCSDARDILGGNGVLLEYLVAKHLADMEIVYTYEGTDIVQSLIVGREITGVQAMAPSRKG
ncbi:MAG: acyl-CoA dehydrogenase family protein [Rubrobacter sp.]|nr:acyl-CoA dehydrogenase family protein [Rubrobacter sp.]